MITQIDVSRGEDQTILSLKVNGEIILFVPKSDHDQLQSSVKELSEENERLKEFATKLIFGNPSYYAEDMEDAKRLLPILMNKALSGKDGE